MAYKFLYVLLFVSSLGYAQVGIGTTTPKAFFNVIRGQTILFGEDSNRVGSENKLIWYASRGAFRAGGVSSDYWSNSGNPANTYIGMYSFASGYNTNASGFNATAMGYYSTAIGLYTTAMGDNTTASGLASTAMGQNTYASGSAGTAMGQSTYATGGNATAMGIGSRASGYNSMATGQYSSANGDNSTAMGTYVSTNGKMGSFILGDQLLIDYGNSATNQMMMRFTGGYVLYTTAPFNQTDAVGVQLATGGNAWTTISDSTRKENFRAADGESFLKKIGQMRLGSWNYKDQDAKLYRHYGPMAQDFFAAFGHDELGTIGEDKSINQADFDGVNLIAIQALIQKVEKLEAELAVSKERENTTQARLDKIEALLNTSLTQTTVTLKP